MAIFVLKSTTLQPPETGLSDYKTLYFFNVYVVFIPLFFVANNII